MNEKVYALRKQLENMQREAKDDRIQASRKLADCNAKLRQAERRGDDYRGFENGVVFGGRSLEA